MSKQDVPTDADGRPIFDTCWCGWKPPRALKVHAIGFVDRVTFRGPECDRELEKPLKEPTHAE